MVYTALSQILSKTRRTFKFRIYQISDVPYANVTLFIFNFINVKELFSLYNWK